MLFSSYIIYLDEAKVNIEHESPKAHIEGKTREKSSYSSVLSPLAYNPGKASVPIPQVNLSRCSIP